MTKSLLLPLALILAAAGCTAAPVAPSTPLASPAPAPAAKVHVDASSARPKQDDGRFLRMHESFLARAASGPVGLLFLGDSITEHWANRAPDVWEKYYGRWHPANFGIGGDQTMGVIWRIEHGELDHIQPRVVVLLLGTNNTATHDGREIAEADAKIISLIRQHLPDTRVLLLAIFPRGPRDSKNGNPEDWEARMAVIRDANARLARLDDGDHVRFLDINHVFVDADGHIPDAIMPDHLHPSKAGYERWAAAMQPLLTEMMARP